MLSKVAASKWTNFRALKARFCEVGSHWGPLGIFEFSNIKLILSAKQNLDNVLEH